MLNEQATAKAGRPLFESVADRRDPGSNLPA
jgi:hypothetical protein